MPKLKEPSDILVREKTTLDKWRTCSSVSWSSKCSWQCLPLWVHAILGNAHKTLSTLLVLASGIVHITGSEKYSFFFKNKQTTPQERVLSAMGRFAPWHSRRAVAHRRCWLLCPRAWSPSWPIVSTRRFCSRLLLTPVQTVCLKRQSSVHCKAFTVKDRWSFTMLQVPVSNNVP